MSSPTNTSSEKDEMRKKAIEKLFEEKSFEPRQLYELADKISGLATINNEGDIFIKREGLTIRERVGLIACARFLGNQLKEQVSPLVSSHDVVQYLRIELNSARARLSELVREGMLISPERGSYRARSLPVVSRFIDEMVSKYAQSEE